MKVPGVLRADRVKYLAQRDTVTDYVARRWLHMLPPDLPAAVVVTLKPYWYWNNVSFATHGTPHDYDANVPIVFYGAGVKAEILHIVPLEKLDGRVLRAALKN
jgi:hypothetical protein